jgi:alpha-ketoglutarate-dependent taurine dioxygenase
MRDDCVGIEGVYAEEAEALIAALAEHVVKPAFIYRHQWRRGNLLMWDNCTVQHRAIQDYQILYGCAAATVPVRANPSRA